MLTFTLGIIPTDSAQRVERRQRVGYSGMVAAYWLAQSRGFERTEFVQYQCRKMAQLSEGLGPLN